MAENEDGAGMAQWLERRTHDGKVRVRVPAGAAGEFSSPGQFSVLTLISVSVPPPCYRSSA